MKKLPNDDASERLRKLWEAYEYPGQMVLRDIARLRKLLRRAYAAMARDRRAPSEEDRENHLWAERRD